MTGKGPSIVRSSPFRSGEMSPWADPSEQTAAVFLKILRNR
jgi:hypothetical protein